MKSLRLLFLSLFLFLLSPSLAHAEAFDITNFRTDIQINEDGTLNVAENIDVFFTEERHGIFRDIDTKGISIDVTNVIDDKGNDWNYETIYFAEGTRLKIGDADRYVDGDQTYDISYDVRKGIRFFNTHDELYWNATGTEWPVDIQNAYAVVKLPPDLKRHQLDFRCFTGPSFSTQEDCTISYNDTTNTVTFTANESLSAYNGLTIVVGMPVGTVQRPATLEVSSDPKGAEVYLNNEYICDTHCYRDDLVPGDYSLIVKKFGYKTTDPMRIRLMEGTSVYESFTLYQTLWFILLKLFIVTILLLILLEPIYTFIKKGKDPAGRGSIMPYYKEPEGMSPAEVGTLIDEKVHMRDISSTIIDLCVRGYLAIKVLPDAKGLIFKSDDYELIKTDKPKPGDRGLNAFEKDLIKDIFGSSKTKKVSNLKNKFYKKLPSLKKSLYKSLVEKEFFPKPPDSVRNNYFLKGIGVIFLGFMILGLEAALLSSGFSFAIILNGIISLFFAPFMPKKTKEGRLAYEKILGLKDYLETAEKHRLKFQEKENIFYRFLPYAMTMKIADKWSEAFKGMFDQPPEWYKGAGTGKFYPSSFVNNLTSVTGSISTAFRSQPSSSGSFSSGGGFSSGFSGGFSGGGFGGGGGGSW